MTENRLEEWKESRNVISRFDQHIFDLRKYGFTFATGLLTANGYILTNFANQPQSVIFAKAAIAANVALILALQFYEKMYLIWLNAAVSRSLILERNLNFELTSSITYSANRTQTWFHGVLMYCGILVAVFLLAFFVLPKHNVFLSILLAGTIIAEFVFYIISRYADHRTKGIDWTIDNLEPSPGEVVRIHVTNLRKKEYKLESGEYFTIVDQLNIIHYRGKVMTDSVLDDGASFTWLWTVPSPPNQIYRIKIHTDDPDPYLHRKIITKPK